MFGFYPCSSVVSSNESRSWPNGLAHFITMKLQDRVCIITGGGHGLGRDFALAFAREGAHLAICGTNEQALASTAAELRAGGHRVLALVADVSDEQAVAHLVEATLAEFGQIDVLVNNA